MPLFLSQTLFGMVYDYNDRNIAELALKLASSGFRDTTRLAATNSELAKDMLLQNKTNVRKAIKDLKEYLTKLDKNLDLSDDEFIDAVSLMAEKRQTCILPMGKIFINNYYFFVIKIEQNKPYIYMVCKKCFSYILAIRRAIDY